MAEPSFTNHRYKNGAADHCAVAPWDLPPAPDEAEAAVIEVSAQVATPCDRSLDRNAGCVHQETQSPHSDHISISGRGNDNRIFEFRIEQLLHRSC